SFVDAIFDIDQFGPTCGTCIETTAPRAPWTNTVNVDLLLDATDPHGPIDVQLSGDVVTPGTFALASPMAVELTAGDGTKTVFVEIHDVLGDLSPMFALVFELDTLAPTAAAVTVAAGAEAVSQTTISLDLWTTDAATFAVVSGDVV